MHPNESEWAGFFLAVKKAASLDLHQYKQEQLRRRVLTMVDSRGLKSLAEFGEFVKKDPANTRWFLDKMAINVSEMFRNPEKWKELEMQIIPELLKRTSRLKIWSAGCSYGAEAHSLAVLLDAKFPGSHQIFGTDIDQSVLEQARAGEFSDADVRGVPMEWRSRYFEQRGGKWFAKPQLKKYLNFRHGDLLHGTFESGFDLILCRNVVIYFNDEAKDRLYKRFFEALKPGGVLFVGGTERIFNAKTIGYETTIPFFYQKPMQGDKVWQNAS